MSSCVWVSPLGGNCEDSANWQSNQVPVSGDSVTFPPFAPVVTVNISTNVSLGDLVINSQIILVGTSLIDFTLTNSINTPIGTILTFENINVIMMGGINDFVNDGDVAVTNGGSLKIMNNVDHINGDLDTQTVNLIIDGVLTLETGTRVIFRDILTSSTGSIVHNGFSLIASGVSSIMVPVSGSGQISLQNHAILSMPLSMPLSYTYTGDTLVRPSATLILNGVITSDVYVTGTLKGIGQCNNLYIGNDDDPGTLNIGNSPGLFTVLGDLIVSSTGTVVFEINVNNNTNRGTDPGFDAIDVIGTCTIDPSAELDVVFINPSVNFSNSFWTTSQDWTFISSGNSITSIFNTVNISYSGLTGGPVPGSISNLNVGNELWIIFSPSSPTAPCFAYKNIIGYNLTECGGDDIIISKQGKYNNKWINIDGLLLTEDHLVKFNDNIMHASEYSNNVVNIDDELVDLLSKDGRFIKIGNINVCTKKIN